MAAGDFRRPDPADTAVEAAMRKGAKDLIVTRVFRFAWTFRMSVANQRKKKRCCLGFFNPEIVSREPFLGRIIV